MSNNINATTPAFSKVQTYPFQQPECEFFNPFNTNEMWVSSFGNGMKMGSIPPLGIPEFENKNYLLAYPNPTKGMLNFAHDFEGDISIYSLLGMEILKEKIVLGERKIDISPLSKGVYLLKTTADDKSKIMKLIKE